MVRRTGREGLHERVVHDKRDAETLRAVASEIREARLSGSEAMCLADLKRAREWLGADELQAEAKRLRALLARCVAALEAVPDPSACELALIEEAKRGAERPEGEP